MIRMLNIAKRYQMGDQSVAALDGVTLRVKRGEFVAIIGPSGSGKSTLMNITGCLDAADEGEYYLDGEAVDTLSERKLARIRNEKIGFKIREAQMQKIPYMLVLGDREVQDGVVAVRSRKNGDMGDMAPEALIDMLKAEIASKAR